MSRDLFQLTERRNEHLHGLHGVLDELHPGVALVLGAGQDLHHLWLLDARRDEEEAALFVGHLPHDQLLEGDDGGALVLQGSRARGEWRRGGGSVDSGRVEEEEEEGGKTNVEEEQEERGHYGGMVGGNRKKKHVQWETQGLKKKEKQLGKGWEKK